MIIQIKTGYFKTLSDSKKSVARLERLIGRDLYNPGNILESREVTQ
jgi:hypothetical protein